MYVPITSSLSVVKSGSMGNWPSSSHYLSFGGNFIRRKLNPSVVHPNWVELWVAFMVGLDLSYSGSYKTANNWLFLPEVSLGLTGSSISFGLNNSSGHPPIDEKIPVYLDGSSFVSHSLSIVQSSAQPFMMTSSQAGNNIFQPLFNIARYEQNRKTSEMAYGDYVWIPVEKNQWRYHLIQFKRTGNIGYNTTMSIVHSISGTSKNTEPNNESLFSTSSALLAEAMKQNTWSESIAKLDGNYVQSFGNDMIIKENDYGILNEFFFGWSSVYSPWRITNIMIRASGSF